MRDRYAEEKENRMQQEREAAEAEAKAEAAKAALNVQNLDLEDELEALDGEGGLSRGSMTESGSVLGSSSRRSHFTTEDKPVVSSR